MKNYNWNSCCDLEYGSKSNVWNKSIKQRFMVGIKFLVFYLIKPNKYATQLEESLKVELIFFRAWNNTFEINSYIVHYLWMGKMSLTVFESTIFRLLGHNWYHYTTITSEIKALRMEAECIADLVPMTLQGRSCSHWDTLKRWTLPFLN